MFGHLNIIEKLIKINSINSLIEDESGDQAISIASKHGRLTIIKLLLKNGANINHKNFNGFTPLMIACKQGYVNIVKYLLKMVQILMKR
jgi:serine/threonine-protein phosphatase 6 regulatory ankyrin repeat subunit B